MTLRGPNVEQALQIWLANEGYPGATDLHPLRGGFGSTDLWVFRPDPGESRLVARLFPVGSFRVAEREALAMHAAASHDLPVPDVVARGAVEGRPVLVTEFVEGETAFERLAARPDRAGDTGRAMGTAMGRLHQVAAPVGLSSPGDWIARGGPAVEPLRDLLSAVPDQDRLLHLDFHPFNVLMQGDLVTGVIDWENTLTGPPHMDLARTRAILRAFSIDPGAPADQRAMIALLDEGLVAGHAAACGPDPHPDLSVAWGLAMTVDDLSRHAGQPGSPVSRDALAGLEAERDAAISRIQPA